MVEDPRFIHQTDAIYQFAKNRHEKGLITTEHLKKIELEVNKVKIKKLNLILNQLKDSRDPNDIETFMQLNLAKQLLELTRNEVKQ